MKLMIDRNRRSYESLVSPYIIPHKTIFSDEGLNILGQAAEMLDASLPPNN